MCGCISNDRSHSKAVTAVTWSTKFSMVREHRRSAVVTSRSQANALEQVFVPRIGAKAVQPGINLEHRKTLISVVTGFFADHI